MQAIEKTVQYIVEALTTDTFTFYYGKRFDQNFEVDEMTMPCVLLDIPIISEDVIHQSTYIEPVVTLSMLVGYKHSIDDNNIEWETIKSNAWTAAKEIVLRMMRDTDNIYKVENMKRTDFTNLFNLNISGCLLEVKVTFKDEDSTCII